MKKLQGKERKEATKAAPKVDMVALLPSSHS